MMKAYYKGKLADCWAISKNDLSPPDWVLEAFQKNILVWLDNRLRILMPALNPTWASKGRYIGYGIYVLAEVGDVIDRTNGRVVTQKTFQKHYKAGA